MTIDFAGVVRMADAIGGVEVCVKQNVWDRPLPGVPGGSGLKLKAGTHKVQGKQALQWLRTRHAWGSDLMRARAQHMYMNSMIRALKEQNVFTDTGRLMGLAEAATKSLKVSEEIGTVKKLYDLGMQLKTVPTNRITMTTMPNIADPLDANHVVPAGADADKLWSMLRDDVPFDKNGSDSDAKKKPPRRPEPPRTRPRPTARSPYRCRTARGPARRRRSPARASAIADLLTGKGFTQAVADRRPRSARTKTVVRYPSADLEGDAQGVAKALGIPPSSVKRSHRRLRGHARRRRRLA